MLLSFCLSPSPPNLFALHNDNVESQSDNHWWLYFCLLFVLAAWTIRRSLFNFFFSFTGLFIVHLILSVDYCCVCVLHFVAIWSTWSYVYSLPCFELFFFGIFNKKKSQYHTLWLIFVHWDLLILSFFFFCLVFFLFSFFFWVTNNMTSITLNGRDLFFFSFFFCGGGGGS